MSQWTHVAAVIRFDALRLPGMPDQSPQLGTPSTFEDWNDDCDIPCGSEGSLEFQTWENPMTNAMAAYTVMIWGDLRDYDDVDEIKAYLARVTKGKMIRSGLAEIQVEYADTIILSHTQNAPDDGVWVEVIRSAYKDD